MTSESNFKHRLCQLLSKRIPVGALWCKKSHLAQWFQPSANMLHVTVIYRLREKRHCSQARQNMHYSSKLCPTVTIKTTHSGFRVKPCHTHQPSNTNLLELAQVQMQHTSIKATQCTLRSFHPPSGPSQRCKNP